ncbi:hypothetical protein NDU88_007799 [Pleurodeles waltl]|uniref:Uncharacterized protein n=1 Tax=Pleurodeles waltl TaxID=8319 RepID=A0AAV7QSR4_PLEWA|nr:hypothetical protein NDU88_007799 [Pleurodeles waltl]
MFYRSRSAQAPPSERTPLSVLLATRGPGTLFRRGRTRPASHREPLAESTSTRRQHPWDSGGQRPTLRSVSGGTDQDFWWAWDGAYTPPDILISI